MDVKVQAGHIVRMFILHCVKYGLCELDDDINDVGNRGGLFYVCHKVDACRVLG